MANAIVEGLLLDEFRSILAKGSSSPIEDLERQLPRIIMTAGALRALATHVEAESTESGIKRVAAALKETRETQLASVSVLPGFGLVPYGPSRHVERMDAILDVKVAEDEAGRLRKRAIETGDAKVAAEASAAEDKAAMLRKALLPPPRDGGTSGDGNALKEIERIYLAAEADLVEARKAWDAAGRPPQGTQFRAFQGRLSDRLDALRKLNVAMGD